MRVALYARVSTEEQARHGISIDAQITTLRAWAKSNSHVIAGEYIDNGVSARKSPSKRPALQSLLNDLAAKQVDLIAFTRLDRWTRNVKGYYQVQDVLDRNHVAWRAVQEDYETVTASGRMKVNIMLSVAENEADRTSERIKSVLAHKVEKGEYIGGKVTFGFMAEGKHIVPNPSTRETAREMFLKYKGTASLYETARFMREQTGRSWTRAFIKHCLENPLYIGLYRGEEYCEGIVEPELFYTVGKMLQNRSVRHNPTGRVFIFAGLLRCSCCGKNMNGFAQVVRGKTNYYYRCHSAVAYHACEHTKSFKEETLETFLLNNVAAELDKYTVKYTITPKKKATDNAKVRRKLDRLKDLYLNELITLDQYKADRAQLEAQIVEEAPPPDLSQLKRLFENDFRTTYQNLNREQRRMFWIATIDRIEIGADNAPQIFFRSTM